MSKGKLAVLLLALGPVTCHQAILTAPPGSSVTLFANPEFIPANGGVSIITAVVIEPAGTPVPDGTIVQFFTNLGRIDEQGKTNDGVARVNLVSDSRSGTATVVGVSGGGAVAPPSPSPTPTAGTSGVSGVSAMGLPEAAGSAQSASAQSINNSGSVTVVIGSALPKLVIVTAVPTRIERTDPRESFIIANVFDENGNPVANVPVIFTIEGTPDPADTERMVSESAPRFTDNNGRAEDVMKTKYGLSAPQKTVTVRARTPIKDVEGTVEVTIN